MKGKKRRYLSCWCRLFTELLIEIFWLPQVSGFLCNFLTLDLRENIFCSFDSSYVSLYFVTTRLSQFSQELFLMSLMIILLGDFAWLSVFPSDVFLSFFTKHLPSFQLYFYFSGINVDIQSDFYLFLSSLSLLMKELYCHVDSPVIFFCWKNKKERCQWARKITRFISAMHDVWWSRTGGKGHNFKSNFIKDTTNFTFWLQFYFLLVLTKSEN